MTRKWVVKSQNEMLLPHKNLINFYRYIDNLTNKIYKTVIKRHGRKMKKYRRWIEENQWQLIFEEIEQLLKIWTSIDFRSSYNIQRKIMHFSTHNKGNAVIIHSITLIIIINTCPSYWKSSRFSHETVTKQTQGRDYESIH